MENYTYFSDLEPEICFTNDNRAMQWIELESIDTYNADGSLKESRMIHYSVPDLPPYEVFPEMLFTNVCLNDLDTVKECEGRCEDCKKDENPVESGPEEPEMLKLTPKGIAIVAAATSGLIDGIDDERFEKFWEAFEATMERHGYTCEV